MNDSPIPIAEVASIAAISLQWGRYTAVAAYTLTVYDWLISLADEYDLILTARRSSIQFAYIICRYAPLLLFPVYLWSWVGDHSRSLCAQVVHPLYGFMVVFQLSAQVVILLRTYAFTGRQIVILYLLCGCFVILAAWEIWLFGFNFTLTDGLYDALGDSGCYANSADAQAPDGSGSSLAAGLILLGAFMMDVMMMLIVIVHCIRLRSVQGNLGKMFLFHGSLVFLVTSALNLVNAIYYFRHQPQFDGLVLPFLLLVSDVLACRLILSLRRRVRPTDSDIIRQQSQLVREAIEQLDVDPPSLHPHSLEDPWA